MRSSTDTNEIQTTLHQLHGEFAINTGTTPLFTREKGLASYMYPEEGGQNYFINLNTVEPPIWTLPPEDNLS